MRTSSGSRLCSTECCFVSLHKLFRGTVFLHCCGLSIPKAVLYQVYTEQYYCQQRMDPIPRQPAMTRCSAQPKAGILNPQALSPGYNPPIIYIQRLYTTVHMYAARTRADSTASCSSSSSSLCPHRWAAHNTTYKRVLDLTTAPPERKGYKTPTRRPFSRQTPLP